MITIKVYTAPWCAPCTAYKENLKQYPNLPIEIIDIDANPEAGIAANIKTVPFTVINKDGVDVQYIVGPTTGNYLQGRVESYEQ